MPVPIRLTYNTYYSIQLYLTPYPRRRSRDAGVGGLAAVRLPYGAREASREGAPHLEVVQNCKI